MPEVRGQAEERAALTVKGRFERKIAGNSLRHV
jgi:hypothetical protein